VQANIAAASRPATPVAGRPAMRRANRRVMSYP
jgi:hypothetical protein